MDKEIFEVEVSNGSSEGYQTSAVLTMPCTQAEFRDALQKARVQDVKTCENELTNIRYPGITADMIGRNVDLLELNLLAVRLTMLSEDDRMGLEGLLQIEKKNFGTSISLPRLINLTFNADICLLAPQVSDTQELGALLYESEMLSDEAMALVDTMEDSDFRERLLDLLGEQHQEEHGGVFTSRGYAEPGGDFKEVYRKGEMFCFSRPSAPVVLEVSKGFFSDPSYDNDKTAILNLPASDADIWRAAGEVDAASLEECAFRCIDCEIPALRPACRTLSSSCTAWTITTSVRMWPRPGIMRQWSCRRSTRICRRSCSRRPRPPKSDSGCWRSAMRSSPTMACSAGRTTVICRSSKNHLRNHRKRMGRRWRECKHAEYGETAHPGSAGDRLLQTGI